MRLFFHNNFENKSFYFNLCYLYEIFLLIHMITTNPTSTGSDLSLSDCIF